MDFLTRSTPESYSNSMAYRALLFSATGTKTGQTHREDVFLYACLRTPTTGYPIKAESKAEATYTAGRAIYRIRPKSVTSAGIAMPL